MSDSNSPRFLPVEKEEDDKEAAITEPVNPPQQAVQENIDSSSREISPERKTTSSSGTEEKAVEEADYKATVSSRESREKQIIAEDDDGFKTPTSSDHKIPAITECPPAPKKPRPPQPKLKRKAPSPSTGAQRSVEIDAPMEIESIFRPITSTQDNADEDDQQKMKKARKDEDHDRS